MSSRALKKLQGDDSFGIKDDELSEDLDTETGATSKKKPISNLNRYDLFNQQQSLSESEVKEDDNETEHTSAINQSINVSSKKKKKKRKKKSSKHSKHQMSSEDNEINDKLICEINNVIGKSGGKIRANITSSSNSVTNPGGHLLTVDTKNLNSQYEMRRTFGKRVVKIEFKRGRGQKPTLKSTYIVNQKDAWPPVSKEIIFMSIVNPPEGYNNDNNTNIIWFTFEHSRFYQNTQNMFLSAVERIDSDFLIKIIRRCPYHIDSLIQLSELCKMTENYAMASELIERAILVMESSLHPKFSLISGNCRLNYRNQENRAFFITLFKHAQYLEARACVRTAFELSKLILSLDPDNDPLAIILIIDYYALRSKQYLWMVQFYDECESTRNLSQLPNMAYSYALSLFYLKEDLDKADKALQYALLMFPGVLMPLLDELLIQPDKRVASHAYFSTSYINSQSPALHQLVSLYICRAKLLWRDAELLPWLERNANIILDRVDNKDDIVNEYKTKRNQRYINPPRPILRHVVLSDYKEKVPLAMFIAKEKGAIVMYDPLPPLDSISLYERKTPVTSPTTTRPVSMFFQSMLPNFNLDEAVLAQEQVDNGIDLDNDGEGAFGSQSYQEFRDSLISLVDAMRDFLSNIRIADRSNNEDADENESFDENYTDEVD